MKDNKPIKVGVPKTIRISDLVAASVNTHKKPSRSDPEFNGLAASIREQGMIHRVAVRPIGDGRYGIIDGHRRVEAAMMLGWKELNCEVLDIGEDEAMTMTVTANIQRVANDPFLEAELIEKILESGRSMKDAALVMGKDESYVARRNRLNALIPEWRKFAKTHDCTLELLHNVASHTPELQRAVADASDLDGYDSDGAIGWDDFEAEFNSRMMNLADAESVFDTTKCKTCQHNAANAGLLFPWLQDGDGATCQCEGCYRIKWNAVMDEICERLRKKGMEPTKVADKWKIPNYWDLAEKRDNKHPIPYIYEDNGLKRILWSVKREKMAAQTLTPEERAERRAANKRAKFLNDAYSRLREALRARPQGCIRDDLERLVDKKDCRKAIVDRLCEECGEYATNSFIDLWVLLNGGLVGASKALGIEGQFTDGETDAWKAHEEEDA